ncbi:MAG: hypothetical protein AABX38_07745 [Candidatus Micrarchaeota archaeon]
MQHKEKHESEQKDQLMETVQQIHKAEDEALRIIEQGKTSAELLVKKSKEESMQIIANGEKESTELKNNLIKEMEIRIESEIDDLLKDAKKDAANIKKQEFDKKMLMQLAKQMLFE